MRSAVGRAAHAFEAERRGQVYAISIDDAEESRKFARKIAQDGRGELTFPLLYDPNSRVIDAYGLRDPAYAGQDVDGIPHPAVYILDKLGKVAWTRIESDYRKRPTNGEIRTALETVKN